MPTSTSNTVISQDGTRIAYDVSGSGPSLVLVAGALGTKDSPWSRKFAAEFAKDFRVINYDRRGRGASSDTGPYSVEREVEDLAAICRVAGDAPIVVGLSSGAALALEAAARGVPIGRLVAFEAPYMVGDHFLPRHATYESEIGGYIARNDRDGAVKHFMRVVGVPGFVLAIMRLLPMWKELRKAAHTLPYDAAIMSGFGIPSTRLSQIRVPTLIVGGGSSPASLRAAVRAVAEVVPNAAFVEIPKQSHAIKAAALSPVVRQFAQAS